MSKRKSKPQTPWLAIANLSMTAITGIAVALFLNYRQEQLQLYLAEQQEQSERDIIELQFAMERRSSLAQLSLENVCTAPDYCPGGMLLHDNGLAAASNVNLAIVLSHIGDEWATIIQDIEVISFGVSPQAIDFTSGSFVTRVAIREEGK